MTARKALNVTWSQGAEAESFHTTSAYEKYAAVATANSEPTAVITSSGDIAAADKSVTQRYQSDYFNHFVHHAQMEPLNAVASVRDDGKSADIWIGSQFPSGLRADVAKLLNTDADNVTIHPCYLGGGFGRRSWHDFGLEAVQLSKANGTPVKLLWSREDDIQYGAYRPVSLQRLSAGVGANGDILSWTHRTIGDDFYLTASGSAIPFYDIANQQIAFYQAATGIRNKHWRAVAHGPNKFAIESFVDEIAAGQGIEPYVLRRRLLAKSPRALAVLDTAVQMSPWGQKLPEGKVLGMAFAEGVGSITAGVVEISVDRSSGKISVHRVWAAIDSGIVIQPENALRQHEGAILQGISSALLESITIEQGVVQQSNFHDYPLLKLADAPKITIKLISSEAPPTGIGEVALPITAAAIGNAFATLTGKRLRTLPFSSTAVKSILNSTV
jgi:isoquinoline 1-oxidoreductase beta subunit